MLNFGQINASFRGDSTVEGKVSRFSQSQLNCSTAELLKNLPGPELCSIDGPRVLYLIFSGALILYHFMEKVFVSYMWPETFTRKISAENIQVIRSFPGQIFHISGLRF